MHRNVQSIIGYNVLATDGEIGLVDDICFDDKTWSTAYLVVKVSDGRRRVLPPTALGKPDWERKEFPVAYSKMQVRSSPGFDLWQMPTPLETDDLSRERYRIPTYEGDFGIVLLAKSAPNKPHRYQDSFLGNGDPHLWSARELLRYHIRATDGKIGRLADFVMDDTTWAIRFAVIDTAHWFSGRKVLVSPQWITEIDRAERRARVNLTMGAIKRRPEYRPPLPIGEEYNARLQEYYDMCSTP